MKCSRAEGGIFGILVIRVSGPRESRGGVARHYDSRNHKERKSKIRGKVSREFGISGFRG
jgi:hypothetical protein